MTATGAGTVLDLSSVVSIDAGFNSSGSDADIQQIQVSDGAEIDLSGLTDIVAPNDIQDRLDIIANGADSQLRLDELTTIDTVGSGRVNFTMGDGAFAAFGDLDILAPATINLSNATMLASGLQASEGDSVTINIDGEDDVIDINGHLLLRDNLDMLRDDDSSMTPELSIEGDLLFTHIDEELMQLAEVIVTFDGTGIPQPQRLEVGGLHVPIGIIPSLSNDNFGFGQMIVGQGGVSPQATVVRLEDRIDNGNSSTGNDEALYLFGETKLLDLDDDALRILGGSTLDISYLPVYAFIDQNAPGAGNTDGVREWINLNDLFPAGQNTIPFDDGFIVRDLDPQLPPDLLISAAGTDNVLRFHGVKGTFIEEFVTAGSGGLDQNRGMAFGPDGNLYIGSDTNDNILRFDGVTGDFIDVFWSAGRAGLDAPQDLIWGPDDRLYVTSNGLDEALVFTPVGDGTSFEVFSPEDAINRPGTFEIFTSGVVMTQPAGMAFGPNGDFYISDRTNNQIIQFDGVSGVFKEVVADAAEGDPIDGPWGMQFDADGQLLVTNFDIHTVARGDVSATTWEVISSDPSLSGPIDLQFGTDGNLYVANLNNDTAVRLSTVDGSSVGGVPFAPGTTLSGLIMDQPRDLVFFPSETTGSISGIKFDDINGNGRRDRSLVQGNPPDVVAVIDVSGSTSAFFDGTPVGDVNGDGLTNTVLDGELAAFIALNQALIDTGATDANIVITVFGSFATTLDMDPVAPGNQLSTHPATDADGNGTPDIQDLITSIQIGDSGVGRGTNYESALQEAEDAFNTLGTETGNGNLVFLSDGKPNDPDDHLDEVVMLRDMGVNISAFGAGNSADLPTLLDLADDAAIFTSTDDLLEVFRLPEQGQTSAIEPGLAGVAIYLDANDNGQLDAGERSTVTREDNPATTIVDETGFYQFANLVAGDYVVREVIPEGFGQTLPDGDGAHRIALTADEDVTGIDFGNSRQFQVTVNGEDQRLPVVTYSGQDNSTSTINIENGSTSLRVSGNGWKKVVFDTPVTITENTVLSFDFASPMLAELQGIGLDNDEDVVNEGTFFFKVAGTDNAFPNLNRDHDDYPRGSELGDVVHYEIPVGRSITGEFSYLTFFNDDDMAPQDGVSVFSNIELFERPLTVTVNGVGQELGVSSYSTQDTPESIGAVEGEDSQALRVTGNGWKKVVFDEPVTITKNTVLSFDFASPMLAELQGIGLDNDEDVVNEGTFFFKVAGIDNAFPNLNRDHDDYPRGGELGDVVHYEIPVGQYLPDLPGEFSYLTFFNDHDMAPQDGVSVFSNIELFEGLEVTINDEAQYSPIESYSSQDTFGATADIEDEGSTLRITGNGWKKVMFDASVTITENTVLSFDFSSPMLAELQGIGFDNDENVVNEGTVFFKVAGTDNAFPNLNRDYDTYPRDGELGDVVHYEIPVGKYITSGFSYLTFFNDDDVAPQDGMSVFSNIELFERPLTVTVNGVGQELSVSSYSTQDTPESIGAVEGEDSQTLRVTGNGWKKVVFDTPVTITENTVLSFDFASSMLAELQGIGFDNDENVVNEGTVYFKVAGTDNAFPNLNRDHDDYPRGGELGDVVHYEIPVGRSITGEYSFLAFFNDDDMAPQDGVSVFSNIELFERPLTVAVNGVGQELSVSSYSTQDAPESVGAVEGEHSQTLRVNGNGWKKAVFDTPVTITENTVLSFDFSCPMLAELQGIGFDNDENVVNEGTVFFKVAGTDNAFPNLNRDYDTYPRDGELGDVVHYEIPVGKYITGEFSYLTFFNDDDHAPHNGVSVFSNIELFEGLEVIVHDEAQYSPIEGYSSQDTLGATANIEDEGSTIRVTGNGWKKIVFDAPVTITENTVLSFDFSSPMLAELQGIGFDNDEDVVNEGTFLFKVAGTDNVFPNLIKIGNYPRRGELGDVVRYVFSVGSFITGEFSYLTFFNDDDRSPQDGVSVISNIEIFESI